MLNIRVLDPLDNLFPRQTSVLMTIFQVNAG